ncbi:MULTISPECIES: Hsp20/alpha crystallin family protein [unclassified Microcoleus]|uniref:Hsp20/alpha crystallin family protein n=1 Tax=unclassified Microcoleus TaxID=2642155 RepID=UPI0025CFDFA6|nr:MULTISPECIES: Hsp20/alpha crystallin family protein [unclassified Microcoleus]
MNGFQTSKELNPYLDGLFSSLLNRTQQSTLWIGNTEETPIASITVHDMETTLILKVDISDIHLVNLKFQITPETLLIQGQPTAASQVEGYFRPSGFESLIPLPHAVQPETCSTQIQPDGVEILFAKQLRVPQSKLSIELPTANLVDR